MASGELILPTSCMG